MSVKAQQMEMRLALIEIFINFVLILVRKFNRLRVIQRKLRKALEEATNQV